MSAVQQGKALYVGVSNYPTEQAHEAAELLRAAGVPLLVHQPRYSIFDRGPENTGLLKLAAADGFGLVAYSPLAQGLLTDKYLDGRSPPVPERQQHLPLAGRRSTTYTASAPRSQRDRPGARSVPRAAGAAMGAASARDHHCADRRELDQVSWITTSPLWTSRR